jgi:hypothetical protein
MGMRKPVHLLQHGMEVKDIVSAAALAVIDAQEEQNHVTQLPEHAASWVACTSLLPATAAFSAQHVGRSTR